MSPGQEQKHTAQRNAEFRRAVRNTWPEDFDATDPQHQAYMRVLTLLKVRS